MFGTIRSLARRVARSYVLVVVLGLIVGLTLAPAAWSTTGGPDGTVAVVPVEGTIDGETSAAYAAMMKQAREDPDIKAVVLIANSGGGGASASEEMYLQTKRTANQMPVVTSIDAGALSGAYQTIVPSDYVYAKPASSVGSIGVLAPLPVGLEPNNIIATSGPNKLGGYDKREFLYVLDSVQRAFVNAVMTQRGEDLTLSRSQIEQARIYSGAQAVDNGLADEVGGKQAAIQEAADRAGLDDYRVRLLRPDGQSVRFLSRNNYLGSSAENKRMVGPEYLLGTKPSPTVFLMVPESYVATAGDEREYLDGTTAATATGNRTAGPADQSDTTEVANESR